MHFSSWLWEQMDENNSIGRFANICWNDINNGCAHGKFNEVAWLVHFKRKHIGSVSTLLPLLKEAHKEYRLYLESN
jgi:hypothetical protein